jgi:hypothetical protein
MGSKRNSGCYGSRPFGTRSALPVVIVACDDTKTAVAYFTEFKREVKATVTVRIEPAPCCGASPVGVLSRAAKLALDLKPEEDGDSIWVLLDTESESHKQTQTQKTKHQAHGGRVQVLLSKPCYEVWTLAHFVDTGETFADCSAVLTRVKEEWKKKFRSSFANKKAQADYGKLMPLRHEAVKNARKRDPGRDPSWTEIYKVVEAIHKLCEGASA